MANQIIACRYQADNGTLLSVGVNSEVVAQDTGGGSPVNKIGYVEASQPADLPLPRQMKPRRVVAFNPAGKRREVICLSPTAPLYAIGQTITLEDSDGASTVYTVGQLKSESFRARRKTAAA